MILRLMPISAGAIVFNGVNIATLNRGALKEYYRSVQGVFQDPFSTYNPIFKADRIFKIIKDEFFPEVDEREWHDKIDSSLEAVGLNPEQVLGKFPHQLSGGQLQRFLIARALLLDIQFLVADEIISMLDASTRIDVLNLLADLKSRGLSILFITHDLSLGYYISERTLILYRGRVVEMGATERIFDNPLHPYTQMLMESVPRLDKKWEAGEVELKTQRSEPAGGCVYYARCPLASEECVSASPTLIEMERDHFVACVHPHSRAAYLSVAPARSSGALAGVAADHSTAAP
jgi:peptide/nickel transport system ATP-binding protein